MSAHPNPNPKGKSSRANDRDRFIRFAVTSNFPIDHGDGISRAGRVSFTGEGAAFWQKLTEKHGATMTDLLRDLARFYWWYMAATDEGQIYFRRYDAPALDPQAIEDLGFEPVELV